MHQQPRERRHDRRERADDDPDREAHGSAQTDRRAQEQQAVAQHELLRSFQALRARLSLEEEDGDAERVVEEFDDAEVGDGDGDDGVPRDGEESSGVDEEDEAPRGVRLAHGVPRAEGVETVESRGVAGVDVSGVAEVGDLGEILAAEFPKLHAEEEDRGDDLDVVDVEDGEDERAAEVEGLRGGAGDADEHGRREKVAGGHADHLRHQVPRAEFFGGGQTRRGRRGDVEGGRRG